MILFYTIICCLSVLLTAQPELYPKDIDLEKYDVITYPVYKFDKDKSNPHQWSNEFLHMSKGNRDVNIKLYPELNTLDQSDDRLIEYLRNNILIKPPKLCNGNKKTNYCKSPSKRNHPNLQKGTSQRNIAGQFYQPEYVERLLGLKTNANTGKQKGAKKKRSKKKNRNIRNTSIPKSTKTPIKKHWCTKKKYVNVMKRKRNSGYKNSQKSKGFFIEAGAGDGEIISNSLYFELKYQWKGLLVEPNPDFHDALIAKNRNAWILPHCLSTKTTPIIVEFFADLLLGGIIHEETSASPHNRTSDGNMRRKIKVQCFPLYSVLQAIGNPKVDYFSLDIEGPEFQVLKTVPWNLVDMKVLGIETEHAGKVFEGSEKDISKYLQSHGFKKTRKVGHDLFFMHK